MLTCLSCSLDSCKWQLRSGIIRAYWGCIWNEWHYSNASLSQVVCNCFMLFRRYIIQIFLYIVDSGCSVAIPSVFNCVIFACRGCLLVSESFFHNDPSNFVQMSGGVVSELEPHRLDFHSISVLYFLNRCAFCSCLKFHVWHLYAQNFDIFIFEQLASQEYMGPWSWGMEDLIILARVFLRLVY